MSGGFSAIEPVSTRHDSPRLVLAALTHSLPVFLCPSFPLSLPPSLSTHSARLRDHLIMRFNAATTTTRRILTAQPTASSSSSSAAAAAPLRSFCSSSNGSNRRPNHSSRSDSILTNSSSSSPNASHNPANFQKVNQQFLPGFTLLSNNVAYNRINPWPSRSLLLSLSSFLYSVPSTRRAHRIIPRTRTRSLVWTRRLLSVISRKNTTRCASTPSRPLYPRTPGCFLLPSLLSLPTRFLLC